ncbi:MAG: DUF58 domain-containing protein [Bacteroidales bacterium]|nr:DUF58 domain-containing protein [Bacteroidales bacterium]
MGFFFPLFYIVAKYWLASIIILFMLDIAMLFIPRSAIIAERKTPERLSNGDDNKIKIGIVNRYVLSIKIQIVDEIPHQFQVRDFNIMTKMTPGEEKWFDYILKPVKRGSYSFGKMNVFCRSPIGFVERRFIFDEGAEVPVYPSFIQMKKYELLAVSNKLVEAGLKKIRKIGTQTEFDHIREYVSGDDYRTMNWKATARKTNFMVNQYQDERSQQVYAIIDMGRVMQMPFEGMTLLDYAINTSLAILNIAIKKYDKAGLLTFTEKIETFLPAERKGSQMQSLMELLYGQNTRFSESNYELMFTTVQRKIRHRSLLILYTNFESLVSVRRQLPFLQRLAKNHLLLIVFFKNTELSFILENRPKNLDEMYRKTIAEKFMFEKKQIVNEFMRNGIYSVLTSPANLTVDTINKYLEFKARGLI